MLGQVRVQASVQSGAALSRASITSGNKTDWTHNTAQTGQTTYTGDRTPIGSGTYNFTFGSIGIESLEDTFKVTMKGDFYQNPFFSLTAKRGLRRHAIHTCKWTETKREFSTQHLISFDNKLH